MNQKEYDAIKYWCVAVTPETESVLTAYKKSKSVSRDKATFYKFINNGGWGCNTNHPDIVLSFEDFQRFVLKIEPEVEPLPFFKILNNTYGNITEVQNNEGNNFKIGDIVVGISGYSRQLGIFSISGFRLSNNQKNICAVSVNCPHVTQYGIGIDKLQHVIEEKKPIVEETLLEKAERLYPIGTRYLDCGSFQSEEISNARPSYHTAERLPENIKIAVGKGNGLIYHKGKWAEIIK